MRVEHDLLLVGVLEGLTPLDLRRGRVGHDARPPRQTGQVAAQQVHHDRLRDVVRVVARDDVLDAESGRAAVEGLAAEHPAVRAVALLPHLRDDLVHRPAVQLVVSDDLQRHVVLHRVPLHGLQTVVPVPFDPLVDGQQDQLEAVVVALVQGLQDGRKDGAVLAAAGADGDALATVEEVGGGDGLMDLGLEDLQKTGLAELVAVLWPDNDRPGRLAVEAQGRRHDCDRRGEGEPETFMAMEGFSIFCVPPAAEVLSVPRIYVARACLSQQFRAGPWFMLNVNIIWLCSTGSLCFLSRSDS